MRKVQNDEIGGVEETGRDDIGEVVMGKTESLERVEVTEFRGNVAREGFVREVEMGDSVVGADDAGPATGGGVGVGPRVEDAGGVGVNGAFQGQKRQTIGVQRGSEWDEEEEEAYQKWGDGQIRKHFIEFVKEEKRNGRC